MMRANVPLGWADAGIRGAAVHSVMEFDNGATALVTDLHADGTVVAAHLDGPLPSPDSRMRPSSLPLRFPGGSWCVGRVLPPLGGNVGPHIPASAVSLRPLFPVSLNVPRATQRHSPHTCLPSGMRVVDALQPLVRGRTVAVLDEHTTTTRGVLAELASTQHTAKPPQRVVFCNVGQSDAAQRLFLEQWHANPDLATSASLILAPDSAPLAEQFLAPFAALSLASGWRDEGRHVVLILENMDRHLAVAAALHPSMGPSSASQHASLLDSAAQLSPANGGGSLTTLMTFSPPDQHSVDAHSRPLLEGVKQSISRCDSVWRIGSGHTTLSALQGLMAAPFRGGNFQGPGMRAYASRTNALFVDAGETALRSAHLRALGMDVDAEADFVMGLYARVALALCPDPKRRSSATSVLHDVAASNALAVETARAVALRRTTDETARAAEAISLGGGATQLRRKSVAPRVGIKSDAASLPPRWLRETRSTPAETLASLFAASHGYTSILPLGRIDEFERRLCKDLRSLPAPETPRSAFGFGAFTFTADSGEADLLGGRMSVLRAMLSTPLPAGLDQELDTGMKVAEFARRVVRSVSGHVPVAVSPSDWERLPPVWQTAHRVASGVVESMTIHRS
jgi:hypothetical protein